ncbi:MAG: tRNA 2-selenouridine(34) synthase MnmH [Rubrivivax sp.]|nr:tRNA 2-selenouridine(34) synthase MnmH [Rubrivivax sp.]
MSLQRLDAAQALQAIDLFDAVIDARSESEFALDHLPAALNWPTLNDAQRQEIGTQYKQISAFEARKRGAAMAARNIAAHLDREGPALPRGWRPLLYCWRGGQRSGALALVLSQIGFEVSVLDGGYRAFRKQVVDALEQLPPSLNFTVICGRTGSGKSRLLDALQQAGAQVLDLEALAGHRGSVLGALPAAQPSQKRFETLLWDQLRRLDPGRTVFVESESRTIGQRRVPESLLSRMRASPCVHLGLPLDARVELLLADYAHHVQDAEGLCERLQALRELRGATVIERWQSLARGGQWRSLVSELLADHYDPSYERSMARNFTQFAQARVLHLPDAQSVTLAQAAQALASA